MVQRPKALCCRSTSILSFDACSQTSKRRTQTIYEDILGRTLKAEIWDLDGAGSSPYSTVVNTYNGRDQVTLVRQYSGSDSSSTYQDTTFDFDGHGRLSSSHKPEQSSSGSPTYTTYTYNPDDTVATMTDPRSAVTTYKYGRLDSDGTDDRALLTKIAYTSPNTTNIPDPDDVLFEYDAAGNRTEMTDGSGVLSYEYDELSRLVRETKDFDDTLTYEPSGGYALDYTYHLTGGLKSINAPFDRDVTYTVDKLGRTTAIGDGTASTRYASGIAHRAFGGTKAMSLSTTDPVSVAMTYDSRLRLASYYADSEANAAPIQIAEYTYHNDSMLKETDSSAGAPFGQTNKYDFAGRLKKNDLGTPYKQELNYDAFDNLTRRQTWTYSLDSVTFNATYSNNRKATGGATNFYDAAGNVTSSHESSPLDNFNWKFDAAGRQVRWEEYGPYGVNQYRGEEITFDGDGRPAKRAGLAKTRFGGVWGNWVEINSYKIYSSVTGKNITELMEDGGHYRTHVYYGGTNFADERNGDVTFIATDPISGSTREVSESGDIPPSDESESRNEIGGLGMSVPVTQPPSMPEPSYPRGGYVGGAENGCVVDGFQQGPGSCSRGLSNGTMKRCPDNNCGSRVATNGDIEILTQPYEASGSGGGFRVPRYSRNNSTTLPDEDYPNGIGPSKDGTIFEGWDWISDENDDKDSIALLKEIVARARERARKRKECDSLLRSLFGGPNSVVASITEPIELVELKGGVEVEDWRAGADRSQTEFAGAIHVYGDALGKASSPLYIPANADGSAPKSLRSFTGESSYSNSPVTFTSGRYAEANNPGSFSNRYLYQYKGGLTILAAHVAGPNSGQFLGGRNAAGSYQIGSIGGPGGNSGGYYVHSHLSFWRNGKKINPRTEFCGVGY